VVDTLRHAEETRRAMDSKLDAASAQVHDMQVLPLHRKKNASSGLRIKYLRLILSHDFGGPGILYTAGLYRETSALIVGKSGNPSETELGPWKRRGPAPRLLRLRGLGS